LGNGKLVMSERAGQFGSVPMSERAGHTEPALEIFPMSERAGQGVRTDKTGFCFF